MMDSYVSPMRSTAPAGLPTQYTDPKRIDALLKSSDPEAVAASGRSYQKFAAAYEKIAGDLLSMRGDLNDAWTGKDAAAAQSQLREVWSTATTVQDAALTFGVTIERHGSEHLAWYKYNKPPSKDLSEAQSWMTGANERVSQAWGSLPQELSTSLPPSGTPVDDHSPAVRTPADDAPFSPSPAGGTAGHGRSDTTVSRSDVLPSVHLHGTPSGGADTDLAGLDTAGVLPGGGIPGGGSTPLPGVGPGPGGSVPTSADGGLFAPGAPGVIGAGRLPGAGPAGTRGWRANASPAAATSEAEAEAAAAARRSPAGPLVGGGSGHSGDREKERTRQTWLSEDEDTWTDGVEAAPEVIGGEPGAASTPEPEPEPADPPVVEIDLTGDDVDLAEVLGQLADGRAKDPAAEIAELKARIERLERQAGSKPGIVTGDSDWLGGGDV
jgi:uncharacterized protein YukE